MTVKERINKFLNNAFNEKIVASETFFSGIYINLVINVILLLLLVIAVLLNKLLVPPSGIGLAFIIIIYFNTDSFYSSLNMLIVKVQMKIKIKKMDYGLLLGSLFFLIIYICISIYKFDLYDMSDESKSIIMTSSVFLLVLIFLSLDSFGLEFLDTCEEVKKVEEKHPNRKKFIFYRVIIFTVIILIALSALLSILYGIFR